MFFWVELVVFISIFKLSLIMFIVVVVFYYFFKYRVVLFMGVVLYGVFIIYFCYEVYWEFFIDIMIWFLFFVFGVEKIIREWCLVWFIIVCLLMLINNFYFVYINFIFIGIYVLFRWLI